MLVMEEVIHGLVVLSHNASSMENLDTLSKNVIIVLTQISLGSQIGQFLQTTMLLKKIRFDDCNVNYFGIV